MMMYRITSLPPEGSVNFPKFLPKSWQDYILRSEDLAVRERRITAAVTLLLLCEDAGIEPPTMVISENGKPDFADSPYHFNITHAGKLLVVAIADRPIGVDLEPYVSFREGRRARFLSAFTEGERALIEAAPDLDRALIECWVKKEAVLKQSGIGLSGFRTVDTAAVTPTVRVRPRDNDHAEYYLCVIA